jgi:hypothetical protein
MSLPNRTTPCHSTGLPKGDFGWGSPVFAKAQRKKVRLIAMFLKLGVQVGSSKGAGGGGGQGICQVVFS